MKKFILLFSGFVLGAPVFAQNYVVSVHCFGKTSWARELLKNSFPDSIEDLDGNLVLPKQEISFNFIGVDENVFLRANSAFNAEWLLLAGEPEDFSDFSVKQEAMLIRQTRTLNFGMLLGENDENLTQIISSSEAIKEVSRIFSLYELQFSEMSVFVDKSGNFSVGNILTRVKQSPRRPKFHPETQKRETSLFKRSVQSTIYFSNETEIAKAEPIQSGQEFDVWVNGNHWKTPVEFKNSPIQPGEIAEVEFYPLNFPVNVNDRFMVVNEGMIFGVGVIRNVAWGIEIP